MIKKIFIVIIVCLATTSCGFTPLAFYKENLNINIEVLDYEGDYQINSALRSKLAVHKNSDDEELYKIEPALKKLFLGEWKSGKVPPLWDGKAGLRIAEQLIKIL